MFGGKTVTVDWQGRAIAAFVPHPLAGAAINLPERVVRKTEQAAAAVRRANDRLAGGFEVLARLLLRAEGVASSSIEGVRAPVALVAVAEVDPGAVDSTAAWVADNLAVVDQALDHAHGHAALTVRDLNRWHARLMAHGHLPERLVGQFRDVQNWIGGATPREAAFVPPPADHVGALMNDLVGFAGTTAFDAVTQAAFIHAQFETIHPYGDGNGRLGRVLIAWVLARRLGVAVPPPVSVVIARDTGAYLSGLTRWRSGDVADWVAWVADTIRRSAEEVLDLVGFVQDVRGRWATLTADLRADAAARRLLDLLPEHVVVSAPLVAELLGVSAPAARGAITALADRGILEPLALRPTRPGRPPQWWGASEVLSAVARWSR